MIRMVVSHECLRSGGKDCKVCVLNCPIHVIGVRKNRIVPLKNHADECILCFTCKGACPVNLDVIRLWEEN